MKTLLIFLLTQNASALTAKGGEVDFTAYTKPGFIKIAGKGSPTQGSLEENGKSVKGKFDFDLNTLDTGIGRRNQHMKEIYLQTDKFPKASFTLESANREKPDFKGTMTLHGVTQPVSGTFTADKEGKVDAKFKIKLSEFKIEKPSFAGITVTDDIDIEVKIDQIK